MFLIPPLMFFGAAFDLLDAAFDFFCAAFMGIPARVRQVFEKKIIRGDKFLKKKIYGATSCFEVQISSHPGRYPHKFWSPP